MNLSAKLSLSVLLGLMALLGVLGYLGFSAVWESTDRTMQERLVLARLVAQDIDQDISQRLQQLQQFVPAVTAELDGGRIDGAQPRLEELYRSAGEYARSAFLLDASGDVVAVFPPSPDLLGKSLTSHPNAQRSLDHGEAAVSGSVRASGEEASLISLSVPVKGESGEVEGALGVTIGPASDFLRSLLTPVGLGDTGYAQVINENGDVIASNLAATEGDAYPFTAHPERFTRLIESGDRGVWTCHRCHEPEGEQGGRREDVMAFAPLTTTPWGVAIRQEKSEAFAPRNDLQKKFLISGSVALAVVLAWALVVGQTLAQPLRRLTRASRRIAGGDLDHAIAVAGKDEVGQLGSAFETMRHALKQSRQEVEERSRAVATLEERDRIAREMHDSLSQTLGYVWLTASASKERLETGDIAAVREQLEDVRQAARDAYEDVRQGIWALRTNGMLEKGLLPTLKEFLDHYSAQTKLQVRLTLPPSLEIELSEAAQVQALRIIQEALANVRKHAQASKVLIEFSSRRGWVHIAIEDDGRGFDASAASANGQHYGLQIMRERAQSVGGALDVFSRVGESTRIVVRLPTSGLNKER